MLGVRHPRRWAVGLALAVLVAGGAVAVPAAASCQTDYCRLGYQIHAQEQMAELRGQLAADPTDAEAVRSLLRLLGDEVWRQREVLDHRTRYAWRRHPEGDLEERVAAELHRWSSHLARLERDDPDAWCRHAAHLPDRGAALALLLRRAADNPGEAGFTVCLARELETRGRTAEARAVLQELLERIPDAPAVDMLARLRGGSLAARRELLEEQARRHPDDPGTLLRLARDLLEGTWNREIRRKEPPPAEDLARGRDLVRALLALDLPLDRHRDACWELAQVDETAGLECWRALLADPFPEAPREAVVEARDAAWRARIEAAFDDGDLARVERWMGHLSGGARIDLWWKLLQRSDDALCTPFVAAFDHGLEWTEPWHGGTVAAALAHCGEEERRRAVLARAGIRERPPKSDAELLVWRAEPGAGDVSRGVDVWPLRRWAVPVARSAAHRPQERRFLETWAADHPGDAAGPLMLALVEEERARRAAEHGDPAARRRHEDRALAHLEAAAALRPEDLDLVSHLGAAALRLGRPETVRAAAHRLREHAALPRHRAEADYLLGRLARREGRWEEASDRLAAYFLERLRFLGPRGMEAWERPFFLHLVEAGHRQRLERYLEARSEAWADFEAHRPPPPPWDRPPKGWKAPSPLQPPDPALLALDCVSPRRPDRVEGADPTAAPCTPEQLPDPEPRFPDDALLALGREMREVG